jgi:hypothetical protein
MSSAPFPSSECKLHLALAIRALGTRSPFSTRRRAFMETLSVQRPDMVALEEEVQEIQHRLGTPAENPNDLERAKMLAHKLANLMCAAILKRDLASENDSAVHCSRAPFSPA